MRWLRRPAPAQSTRASHKPGQAIVEFALTALIYMTMIIMVFEGARLVYTYVALTHAVQEGARTAALKGKSEADVRSRVIDAADPITVASGNIAIGGNFSTRDLGDRITVSATYSYTPLFSVILGSGSFTLSGTSEIMAE